jgi:hypothetical protein
MPIPVHGLLRFALCKAECRRLFRKGGRSQFDKTGQNEFKTALTNADSIRKHMRVLTANPVVAQVGACQLRFEVTRKGFQPEIRSDMSFDIDQWADRNQLRID